MGETDGRDPGTEAVQYADPREIVVHAEIYNRRGELQKIFDVSRLERVGKYWTSLAMVVSDSQQRTRTELVVEKAEYDIGLTEADFSRRELERGGG